MPKPHEPSDVLNHSNPVTHSISQGSHLGRNDALYTAFQVAFKHMCLGQLLIPMGRQPNFGQRPTFAENKVGIEHCPGTSDHQGLGVGGTKPEEWRWYLSTSNCFVNLNWHSKLT